MEKIGLKQLGKGLFHCHVFSWSAHNFWDRKKKGWGSSCLCVPEGNPFKLSFKANILLNMDFFSDRDLALLWINVTNPVSHSSCFIHSLEEKSFSVCNSNDDSVNPFFTFLSLLFCADALIIFNVCISSDIWTRFAKIKEKNIII